MTAALRSRVATRLIATGVVLSWLGGPLPAEQRGDAVDGRFALRVAEVDALIHPASAEFITQTIDNADAAGADVVVLVLRTPGGLVDSTRDINTSIIEARTPVVVFVGPSGARARFGRIPDHDRG